MSWRPAYVAKVEPEQLPGHKAPRYKDAPTFTLAEVAAHDTVHDGWIAVDGRVYNITNFISNHPGWLRGGQTSTVLAIQRTLGTECSDEFRSVHSVSAQALLPQYFIGHLAAEEDGSAPYPNPNPNPNPIPNPNPNPGPTPSLNSAAAPEEQEDVDANRIRVLAAASAGGGTISLKVDPATVTVARLKKLLRVVLKSRMGEAFPSDGALNVAVAGTRCSDEMLTLAALGVTAGGGGGEVSVGLEA